MSNTQEHEHLQKMLIFSNLINELAKPFFNKTGITNFGLVEVSSKGAWRMFNSNAEMFSESIEANILHNTPSQVLQTFTKPGFYLLDADKVLQEKEKDLSEVFEKYQCGHGLRFVNIKKVEQQLIFQLFTFESHITNNRAYQDYLSHLSTIEDFTKTFNNRIAHFKAIAPLETHDLHLLEAMLATDNFTDNKSEAQEPCEIETPETSMQKITLTKRENEVLHWYVAGKTALETSMILEVSKKTVERHFENIRKKLNCKSKFEIYTKLKECEYF